MSLSKIDGDLFVNGTLTPKALNFPSGSIVDANVNAAAAIATTKVRHRYTKSHQQPNATATTETKAVHVVRGSAATIMEIVAGSIVANIGAATVTVDVKKNGSSVLTGVLTLNSSNTARIAVPASITGGSTALVVGDWIEVVITATAGGGTLATGVYVQVMIDEDPS